MWCLYLLASVLVINNAPLGCSHLLLHFHKVTSMHFKKLSVNPNITCLYNNEGYIPSFSDCLMTRKFFPKFTQSFIMSIRLETMTDMRLPLQITDWLSNFLINFLLYSPQWCQYCIWSHSDLQTTLSDFHPVGLYTSKKKISCLVEAWIVNNILHSTKSNLFLFWHAYLF